MNTNSLLQQFDTPYQTPPFHLIKEEDYLPAFKEAIKNTKEEIDSILKSDDVPDFFNTIEPLEKAGKKLNVISYIFFNINHANTNENIQGIAREVSPLITEFSNDIKLNKKLFDKIKHVYDNSDRGSLREDQVKLLDDTYKEFVLNGALLEGKEKDKYREITKELGQLSLKFGENVLAETNDFKLHLTDKKDVSGLPGGALEAASALAKSEGKDGWMFSLHLPSYMAFMTHADNRELREKLFREYSKRGNRNNDHDNKEVISKMVSLRVEKAQLLGFDTHADLVLQKSMASTKERVNGFLQELLDASIDFGQKDVKDVAGFAKSNGLNDELQRWDFMYYSEKLKTSKFGLNDEMLRPYFKLENVEKGVLGLAERLYGIKFTEVDDIPKYHDEVKTFRVDDETGDFLGVLYLDYFPRPSKQGGAWMTSFRDQYIDDKGKDVRPQISLVMNFTRPTETKPSLLTFREVQTFLHEFGHGLHGMLSRVHYESQSGTNVYRDFVELPSQLMENWSTEKEWLKDVGIHYETGEVIPDELLEKIKGAETYLSGYQTVRQLSFGLNDMAWHTLTDEFKGNVVDFEKKAMAPTELFPPVEGSCVSTALSHIFDGGYSAGYYGYKWAEVLDADAFEAFKEKGIFNKEVAGSFRKNILERGGTKHPMELYKAFRGKEPSIEPLLKRGGLIKK